MFKQGNKLNAEQRNALNRPEQHVCDLSVSGYRVKTQSVYLILTLIFIVYVTITAFSPISITIYIYKLYLFYFYSNNYYKKSQGSSYVVCRLQQAIVNMAK